LLLGLLLLPSVFLKYGMVFRLHAIIKKKRHTGCIEKRGEHNAYRRIRIILTCGRFFSAHRQTTALRRHCSRCY
jgi:hypothetical protein